MASKGKETRTTASANGKNIYAESANIRQNISVPIYTEKIGMNNDIDRLADLLANLIEKYANKIDLDTLPEPHRPTDE